jgi:hypothetical protein
METAIQICIICGSIGGIALVGFGLFFLGGMALSMLEAKTEIVIEQMKAKHKQQMKFMQDDPSD